MQTLITKYYGPTNTKPSRIKVTSWKGSKFYDIDFNMSFRENNEYAANLYVQHYLNDGENSWHVLAVGQMPGDTGYAFIIE